MHSYEYNSTICIYFTFPTNEARWNAIVSTLFFRSNFNCRLSSHIATFNMPNSKDCSNWHTRRKLQNYIENETEYLHGYVRFTLSKSKNQIRRHKKKT